MGLFKGIWDVITEPVGDEEEKREHVVVQKDVESMENQLVTEGEESRGIVEDAYSTFSDPKTTRLDRVEKFVTILQSVPLEQRNATIKQLLSTDEDITTLQSEALERRDAIVQAIAKHQERFEIKSQHIDNQILEQNKRKETKQKEIADFIKAKQQELTDYITECDTTISKLQEDKKNISDTLSSDLAGANKEMKRLDDILSVLEEV